MQQVSINIANRTYEFACGLGQQDKVRELASYVDAKVGELRRQMPAAPEIKLIVSAALMLAEESREARRIARQAENARATVSDSADTLVVALEELITSRVDKLSKKVASAA